MTNAKPILDPLEAGSPITESWINNLVDHVRSGAPHGRGSSSITTGIGTFYRDKRPPVPALFRIENGESLAAAVDPLTSPTTAEANILAPDEDNVPSVGNPQQLKEVNSETYTLVNRSRFLSAAQNSLVVAIPLMGEWLVISVLES